MSYIIGYDKLYTISEDGVIVNEVTGKRVSVFKNNGYLRCKLSKEGKQTSNYLHRLLAINFLPNPDNLPQVNHIDGDRLNNKLSNLEWVTAEENLNHAREAGLQFKNKSRQSILTRPKTRISAKNMLCLLERGYTKNQVSARLKISVRAINDRLTRKEEISVLVEELGRDYLIIDRLKEVGYSKERIDQMLKMNSNYLIEPCCKRN